MTRPIKTGALVAVAGLSSRMGAFKPMLPLGENTILRRGIMTLLRSGCDPVAVVTGHRSAMLQEHLSDLPVTSLYNPDYAVCQMLDSVKIGLGWLADRCDRLLFSPGDVCLYGLETVRALLCSEKRLCYPIYEGKRGHPVLLSCSLIPDILAYDGGRGLAGALSAFSDDAEELPVEEPGILLDVDTYGDYRKLLAYDKGRCAL